MIVLGHTSSNGPTVNNVLDRANMEMCGLQLRRNPRRFVSFRREDSRRIATHGIVSTEPILLVRYGLRCPSRDIPDGLSTVQKLRGMNIIANKLRFRRWAMENNVSVPRTWTKGEDFVLPALGRPLRHTQGKNYHVYHTEKDYAGSNDGYYSRLVSKVLEYRVYTFNGYVWCVSQKNPAEGVSPYDPWNFSTGGATFKIIKSRYWDSQPILNCCKIAMDASRKLGLLHAAADMIIDEDHFEYIVEINNAPALEGRLKPILFTRLLERYYREWIGNDLEPIPFPTDFNTLRHPWL